MITKETAVKIWNCYNEIENAEKILSDLAKTVKADKEKEQPSLTNAFGERVGLQLGVPSGPASHQLFGVNLELGVKVIEEHIEKKRKRLEELEVICKLELGRA